MERDKENSKIDKPGGEGERTGSADKEKEIKNIPPVSMDEINELKNDIEETGVNPSTGKRSPLNPEPDTDPNDPINAPAL